MCTERSAKRERKSRFGREHGVGSTEMILILPLIMTLVLMQLHGTRMMLAKEHAVTTTRRAAWIASLGRHIDEPMKNVFLSRYCAQVASTGEFDGRYEVSAGIAGLSCADEDKNESKDFLEEMERIRNPQGARVTNPAQGVIKDVLPKNNAVMTTVEAGYEYTVSPWFDDVTGDLSHTVSGNRSWEIGTLPLGYNKTIKKKLGNAHTVFDDVFPKK